MPDPRTSKPPAVDLGAEGTAAITAVCCSGGGIRSASFNLGALQELAARRVMDDVDMMCAVSGGSYIAASHTLVAHGSHPRPPLDDVYAPGSAEEKWLRGNSRYLLPNVRVALQGGVRLLFGIAANLVLVLSWLFVFAHATGWLLNARGWLSGIAVGRPASSVGSVWLLPAVLAGASVLIALFAGDRSPWPSLSWWCMAAAVVVALVSLAAPRAIQTAYDAGLHDGGNVGTVVRGFGFASPGGCADARAAEPDPAKAICGNTTASTAGAATNAPSDAQGQGAGFLAFVAALAALVRLVLGKLRGEAPATGGTSVLAKVFDAIRRIVLPWVGTIGVIGLLAVFTLRWMADGALAGYTAAELVKVLAAAGVIVAFRFTIDVNHTSMHGFYRDRLAYAYGIERQSTSTVVGRPQVRLSELAADRPDLVLCAAANVNVGIADDEVPPGRDAMSFSFTPHRIGLSARAPAGTDPDLAHVPGRQDVMVSTPLYERVVGKTMTLFGAVALSGAAVSPLMGKMTRPAQRFLFAIADVRLGLWLPNPRLVACAADPSLPRSGLPLVDRLRVRAYRARLLAPTGWSRFVARGFFRATQPNLRLLCAEAFGHQRVRTSWIYVTDGGHFENLGLVEALRRGATEVYVFDASGDDTTSWNTLGEAIALARSELGVEIDIDPEQMLTNGACTQPFVHGTYVFTWDPDRTPGVIHLCKLTVWPGAPWDVLAYASRHRSFPTDSVVQQMYDDEEFEAYRALGRAATRAMLDSPRPAARVTPAAASRAPAPVPALTRYGTPTS